MFTGTPLMIVNRLEANGFEALFVGGCIRDRAMGKAHDDVDIATNATPDEIIALFPELDLELKGKQYGVIIIKGVEVASFRTESYEVQGKPIVEVARSFKEDADRRDYTINSMGMKKDGTLFDYHNGMEDIHKKLIQTVGNPLERFEEDPSRILRGLYFASRFGFDVEEETLNTIINHAYLLEKTPIELKGKILEKVMKHRCLHDFMVWLKKTGVLRFVFPELVHTVGLRQNPKYHNSTVYNHILRVIRSLESNPECDMEDVWGGVYHDVKKGDKEVRSTNKSGQPSDVGHEEAGYPFASKRVKEFQFGSDTARIVEFLVRFHGLQLEAHPKRATVIRVINRMVPYFATKEELIQGIDRLFRFMDSDADGFAPDFSKEKKTINALVHKAMKVVLQDTIFYRAELPVNGKDVQAWGVQGKAIGEMLELLVRENIQSREEAFATVEKIMNKRSLTI